ncbi:hypothetical protein HYPSUDRAFT_91024 [Hypholoma sublateritium FD-334 SS-4]|uniref:non-specific serine/threonine protein kinase n=1 Tax=Hypholoma sublateritium (strain FD-334 SS-4) TaxID=945553 RepID=A0A0D2P944_HYPSF|nr:hypothetical protein HYPSUDRAFT_91024 [Hypholoma sublateritium FD-334 SS-4]
MLSALNHIHTRGIVHCDIKPNNILCSPMDPSKLVLIDFGISRPVVQGVSGKPDAPSATKRLVGSPHWASLNAHRGLVLGPRDDLESLALTALFLVRGDLPWRTVTGRSGYFEPEERALLRIYAEQASTSGAILGAHLPPAFSGLLDYSRGLAYDHTPDYADWRAQFALLDSDIGVDPRASGTPLDWTAVGHVLVWMLPASNVSGSPDSTAQAGACGESGSSSYFDVYGEYEMQGARDDSLTPPTTETDLADSGIPQIAEVLFHYNSTGVPSM